MEQDNQYSNDAGRLAELLEKHTGIPRRRISTFINGYGVEQILPCANQLCSNDTQRNKLTAIFDFKNMYDLVKQGEKSKGYTLDSAHSAMEYFCNYFADTKDREYFVAAYLNNTHDVITTKTISAGSLNSSAVYPREILKEALFCNANSVMVAHNHPSGSLTASDQDRAVTKELRKCFEATGVQLLDHFVVAGDKAISIEYTSEVYQRKINADIPMAASPASEKAAAYKPPRIKDQLAMAQGQMALDTFNQQTNKKSHDRGDR
jgi:DNA repair protein RadC